MAKVKPLGTKWHIVNQPQRDGSHALFINCRQVGTVARRPGMPGWFWVERPEHFGDERDEVFSAIVNTKEEQWQNGIESPPEPVRISRYIKRTVKQAVMARDQGICQRCGQPGSQYHHVIPAILCGPATVENIKLACESCNRKMWHLSPD